MIDAKRRAVVEEARSWIGTPYHPQGSVKGVGVDCGMLLVEVFCRLGLTPPFDPRPYPMDWHMHRDDERYLGFIRTHAARIDQPEPGDIALFRYGRCYSHGGIITGAAPLSIVHALYQASSVIEERVSTSPQLTSPHRRMSFWSVFVVVQEVAA